MPNEDIDVSNLERLEKYRSFDRYRRRAEQEARAPHWWRTYREHFGVESGAGRPEQGGLGAGLGGPTGVLPEHWGRGQPASLLEVLSYQDFSHLLVSLLGKFPPSLLEFHLRYFCSYNLFLTTPCPRAISN